MAPDLRKRGSGAFVISRACRIRKLAGHVALDDKMKKLSATAAVVAVLLTVAAMGEHEWWPLARAAIGAASLFAFYFALVLAYPAGMGFGDVKLAGVLGALMGYLSWSALIVATFGAFLLGAVVGVTLILASRGGRKTAIPFGPFMIGAALITVFSGGWLAHGYLRLMGGG